MWRVTCSLYFDLNRDGFRDFWIWAPIILAIIVGGGLLDWFWGHLFGASTVRRYLGWFFLLLVALHSDYDGLRSAIRLAPGGVWDQRGPRCCAGFLAAS